MDDHDGGVAQGKPTKLILSLHLAGAGLTRYTQAIDAYMPKLLRYKPSAVRDATNSFPLDEDDHHIEWRDITCTWKGLGFDQAEEVVNWQKCLLEVLRIYTTDIIEKSFARDHPYAVDISVEEQAQLMASFIQDVDTASFKIEPNRLLEDLCKMYRRCISNAPTWLDKSQITRLLTTFDCFAPSAATAAVYEVALLPSTLEQDCLHVDGRIEWHPPRPCFINLQPTAAESSKYFITPRYKEFQFCSVYEEPKIDCQYDATSHAIQHTWDPQLETFGGLVDQLPSTSFASSHGIPPPSRHTYTDIQVTATKHLLDGVRFERVMRCRVALEITPRTTRGLDQSKYATVSSPLLTQPLWRTPKSAPALRRPPIPTPAEPAFSSVRGMRPADLSCPSPASRISKNGAVSNALRNISQHSHRVQGTAPPAYDHEILPDSPRLSAQSDRICSPPVSQLNLDSLAQNILHVRMMTASGSVLPDYGDETSSAGARVDCHDAPTVVADKISRPHRCPSHTSERPILTPCPNGWATVGSRRSLRRNKASRDLRQTTKGKVLLRNSPRMFARPDKALESLSLVDDVEQKYRPLAIPLDGTGSPPHLVPRKTRSASHINRGLDAVIGQQGRNPSDKDWLMSPMPSSERRPAMTNPFATHSRKLAKQIASRSLDGDLVISSTDSNEFGELDWAYQAMERNLTRSRNDFLKSTEKTETADDVHTKRPSGPELARADSVIDDENIETDCSEDEGRILRRVQRTESRVQFQRPEPIITGNKFDVLQDLEDPFSDDRETSTDEGPANALIWFPSPPRMMPLPARIELATAVPDESQDFEREIHRRLASCSHEVEPATSPKKKECFAPLRTPSTSPELCPRLASRSKSIDELQAQIQRNYREAEARTSEAASARKVSVGSGMDIESPGVKEMDGYFLEMESFSDAKSPSDEDMSG